MKNIDIPLPRLLDDSGAETGRITPARVSVSLSLTPLSTATMELLPGQAIKPRQWAELFTVNGSAGIYRANVVETGYGDQRGNAQFDHGAAEIGDYIVTAELDTTAAAPQAFATVFSYYRGTLWQLGTVEASDTLSVNTSYENVLQAMLALMEQLPNYYLDFDQSSRPWVVSVKQKPANVAAEGRLSRNVESAVITTDPTSQCTRLYMDGLPAPGYVEADNIATEKVLEQYLYGGGDDLTAAGKAQLAALAQRYIAQHKTPARSIQITGHDFSAITGEPLDRVAVGKLYRLALEEYGETALDHVTAMQFPDVYETPFACTLTLAQEATTIDAALSRLMREVLGGGGSAYSRLSQEVKQEFKKFETFINQTDEYIQLLATEAEWDELAQEGHVTAYTQMMRTARYILDEAMLELPYEDWKPQYLAAHPEDAELDDEALYEKYRLWITANPYAIYNSEYSDATRTERIISKTGINSLGQNETLYSKYTQASDAITAEVTRATGAEGQLSGRISVTENQVALKVSRGDVGTQLAVELGNVSISGGNLVVDGYITADKLTTNSADVLGMVYAGGFSAVGKNGNTGVVISPILSATSTLRVGSSGEEQGSETGDFYFQGMEYDRKRVYMGQANNYLFLGNFLGNAVGTDLSLNHAHAVTMQEITSGANAGKVQATIGNPVAVDSSERIDFFDIAASQTFLNGVAAAKTIDTNATISLSTSDFGQTVTRSVSVTNGYDDTSTFLSFDISVPSAPEGTAGTLEALYSDEDATHEIAVGSTGRILYVPLKYRLSTDENASWWTSRVSVDASLAYEAGQNSVGITGPVWSSTQGGLATSAQATFSTDAPTPDTESLNLYLTQSDGKVYLRSGSASGDARAAITITQETPALYYWANNQRYDPPTGNTVLRIPQGVDYMVGTDTGNRFWVGAEPTLLYRRAVSGGVAGQWQVFAANVDGSNYAGQTIQIANASDPENISSYVGISIPAAVSQRSVSSLSSVTLSSLEINTSSHTVTVTYSDGTTGTAPININAYNVYTAAYNQGLIDGGSEVPDVTLAALYADEDSTHAIAVGPTGRVLFVPMKYRLSTDENASWWTSRISVDASLAYTAGQNAVSITGPTWSQPATNAQATFSTNAPTPNTKQLGLYLTQAGLTVQLRSDSASGDIRAYTSVEAPRLYHTDVAPDGTESGPYEWTSTINGNQVPGYTIKIKAANSGWSGTERSIIIPAAVAATMQALYVDEDATHEIGIGPTGKMLFVPMKYRLSSDSEASWWSSRINVDASLAYEAGEASVALTDWSNANVSEATTSQIAYLGKRVASTTADVAVGVTLSNGKSYSRWITGLDISDAYNAGRNSYGKSVTLRYVGAVAGVYTWTTSTYVSGLTENSRYTVHFDV